MRKPVPFGKYLLLERVNVGGMAEVFLAKAFGVEGFERLLAIKRILPTMVEDEEFITMFLDEARISVQLNHAHVVQIHELGKHDDSFYIAMEYVSGRDLRHLMEKFRKKKELMPTAMAVFIASKMCEGLDYAHRKKDARGMDLNIVHRDVSPQNILLSYEGEVKIIDFGIAKAANRAQKTQAGILKGKFGYMSPEQVRGLPIDRRSDIFAVGVILYEMLTGEKLFVGESDFSTLEKVRNADVLPPRQYNSNIPVGLEKVVMKSLARDVEDRYQWASDMAEDLMRFLLSGDTIFSGKTLSNFLKENFAEDLARETERLERFAEVERPDQLEISGVTAAPGRSPRTATPQPRAPVIPDPEPDELERADRTQIFRPEFNEPATAPEEPTGRSSEPEKPSAGSGGIWDRGRKPTTSMRSNEPPPDEEDPDTAATVMGWRPPTLTASAAADDDVNGPTILGGGGPPVLTPAAKSAPTADLEESNATVVGLIPAFTRDTGGESNATVVGLQAPVITSRPPPRTRTPEPPPPDDEDDATPPPDDDEPSATEPGRKPIPVKERSVAAAGGGLANRKPLLIGGGVAVALLAIIGGIALTSGPSTGQLVILAEPAEKVSVTLDGKQVKNQEPMMVPVGEHEVTVRAVGYPAATQKVVVTDEAPATVRIALREPEPEPEPAPPPPEPTPPPEEAAPTEAAPTEAASGDAAAPAAGGETQAQADPPPAQKPRYFDLKVESDPGGAEIEINGKSFGRTPRTLEQLDPAKVSKVKLSLRGYESRTETVTWDGEQREVAVYAILEKKPEPARVERPAPKPAPKPAAAKGSGKLMTSSQPVAKVAIDGKDTGMWTPIPPAKALVIPAGSHTITFTAADGRKAKRKITVKDGETVKLIGVSDFK